MQQKSGTGFGNQEVIFSFDYVGGSYVPANKLLLGDAGVDGGFVSAANPLPVKDSDNATLNASISALNETLLTYLSAIFEKMPRLQANDRVMCDLSETSLATITALTTANDLLRLQGFGGSTINVTKAADGIPVHLSNVGALHLYDKIIVS